MRCVVVGAGAWGLPAAAELAGRGHDVTLVDRFGVANTLSSSPGPTRLWRLTHPDAVRVRLARRSVEAMERLASRSGTTVFLRRGLLWRDDVSLPAVVGALDAEGVPHEVVPADEVARVVPGLVPDGRDAVWQEEAGPVLAAASMAAQAGLFEAAGGTLRVGGTVVAVETRPAGPRVTLEDGATLHAGVIVLAPGARARVTSCAGWASTCRCARTWSRWCTSGWPRTGTPTTTTRASSTGRGVRSRGSTPCPPPASASRSAWTARCGTGPSRTATAPRTPPSRHTRRNGSGER